MAIPDFHAIMLPLLKLAGDGREHSNDETKEALAKHFKLSNEELNKFLPSGRQTIFGNRVAWAKVYLKMAGLLEATGRGRLKITPRGFDLLKNNPSEINLKTLEQFPEYLEFRKAKKNKGALDTQTPQTAPDKTPLEILESSFQQLRQELAGDLLAQVKKCAPPFFEQLVIDLLLRMGYGGSLKDAAERLGRSGDGGLDGIIKEDRLGLDSVYIQAKRWDGPVGRPEIQKFVGALSGQRAKKGVFLTTSHFSKEAQDFVEKIEPRIVLIDGAQLAELMIDCGLGVTTVGAYEIKRIDGDYFADE